MNTNKKKQNYWLVTLTTSHTHMGNPTFFHCKLTFLIKCDVRLLNVYQSLKNLNSENMFKQQQNVATLSQLVNIIL